jgi:hypothetical protein
MHIPMFDRMLERAYDDSLGLVLISLLIGSLAAFLLIVPILAANP